MGDRLFRPTRTIQKLTIINTTGNILSHTIRHLPEGITEGVNFAGLQVFTGRPARFNPQACQQKLHSLQKKSIYTMY